MFKYFLLFWPIGGSEVKDLDDDPVLMLKDKQPEAWSVTVDKKVSQAVTISVIVCDDVGAYQP